jgi:hypothetical protein
MSNVVARPKDHLRLADVPREYPVSRAWVLEQVRLGRLKAFKPSRMVTIIRRADLVALIEGERTVEPQTA